MSYSNSFPTQTPSLNLNFATGSDQFLDSRISFSRADTPPTYAAPSAVHYWSNEKHLSSENLITQSQFSGWAKLTSPTVTAAYTNGPDGSSNTATRLQSASGSHRYFYSTATSWTSGQQYTVSCWVKSNTGVAQTFAFFLPSTAYATADLTTHATDWTRITATFTAYASSTYCGFKLLSANTTDLSIWGFQVNSGANALDYQATSGQIHRSYAPTLKSVVTSGQPRFEFDPASDGQSVGLLIESQATSLITYSEDFSNSFWDKTRLSVDSNVATAPDGALTASALRVDGTAASTHRMRFTYATGGATAQTFSIFAKAGSKSWLALKFDSSGGAFDASIAYFNLASGTTGTVDSGVTATINDCGNGWYRCSVTRTALASATGQIELYVAEADNDVSIDGNSYDHILCWGAQVEANTSAPSSYIKSNSGSSTTKSADSCSVALSDAGYNGGPVTGIVEANNIGKPYPTFATLTDSTANQRVMVQGSSTASIVETFVVVGGSVVANPNSALTLSSSKVGFRCDTDNFATVVNGGTVATDTSGPQPATMTTLHIGSKQDGNFQVNGTIGRLSLYSAALSNVELQSLTSNP